MDLENLKSVLSVLLVSIVIFVLVRNYFKQKKGLKDINNWMEEKQKDTNQKE